MKSKKIIIIPALSSFRKVLEIQDREIKGAIFLQSKVEDFNATSAEFALSRLPFIDMVDWYTMEKAFQEEVIELRSCLIYAVRMQ